MFLFVSLVPDSGLVMDQLPQDIRKHDKHVQISAKRTIDVHPSALNSLTAHEHTVLTAVILELRSAILWQLLFLCLVDALERQSQPEIDIHLRAVCAEADVHHVDACGVFGPVVGDHVEGADIDERIDLRVGSLRGCGGVVVDYEAVHRFDGQGMEEETIPQFWVEKDELLNAFIDALDLEELLWREEEENALEDLGWKAEEVHCCGEKLEFEV